MIRELNLLVVEDNEFQREVIVALLRRMQPKKVCAAEDGQQALELIEHTPIDAVISDIDMPNMDGLEFMRRLAASGHAPSVIIVSAIEPTLLASTEAMARAYGINVLGVISKPVSLGALERLLLRHAPATAVTTKMAPAKAPFTLSDILAGIAKDQFEPFFQPKVDLATRRVVGAEALARWRHPQQGIVPPIAYISTLEESGNIDELMWVMLRKSAAFCGSLNEMKLESAVAVNLSLTSLNNVELTSRISEIMAAHDVEHSKICLEITESAATTNLGTALENLTRLRMKGFKLSIDDFGTGYSSMQQLTRIPFTELKIDRSFVAQSGTNETAKVILRSSLQIARELNIKAVAEGVETQQDWDLLQELGCDHAQGYFIAKPMDAASYLAWLRGLSSNPASMFIA